MKKVFYEASDRKIYCSECFFKIIKEYFIRNKNRLQIEVINPKNCECSVCKEKSN